MKTVLGILSLIVVLFLAVGCSSPPLSEPAGIDRVAATQGSAEVVQEKVKPSQPVVENVEVAGTYRIIVREIPGNFPKYQRKEWRHWIDIDKDCQNTRAEVLIAESVSAVEFEGCRVVSGTWHAPFTATLINKASKLDVDHMVPLSNAHRSGGFNWDTKRKQEYANDLKYAGHLIAVTSSANRSKGDKGPEAWRPKEKAYWCQYAVGWMHIKAAWELSVTSEELAALKEMTGTCAKSVTIKAISSPYNMPKAPGTATSSIMILPGKAAYIPGGPDRDCGDFRSWKDAQEFYEIAGGPMTDSHRLDRDKNGIACESLPGAP